MQRYIFFSYVETILYLIFIFFFTGLIFVFKNSSNTSKWQQKIKNTDK